MCFLPSEFPSELNGQPLQVKPILIRSPYLRPSKAAHSTLEGGTSLIHRQKRYEKSFVFSFVTSSKMCTFAPLKL